MKGMESGKDKVKKICDVLRKETLEPAKVEAQQIIEKARRTAEELLSDASRTIEKMHIEAKQQIEKQRKIFESSISQGCRQAVEALRQEIEEKLFAAELKSLLSQEMQKPQVIAELISAVVSGLEKEGMDVSLSAYIPASVPARSVNTLLVKNAVEKLAEKGVLVGSLEGGVELKMRGKNIILDLSSEALFEIVSKYVRKDFRDLFFGKA